MRKKFMDNKELLAYLEKFFTYNDKTNSDSLINAICLLQDEYNFVLNSGEIATKDILTSWLHGFITHPNNTGLSFSCVIGYLISSIFNNKYGFTIEKK